MLNILVVKDMKLCLIFLTILMEYYLGVEGIRVEVEQGWLEGEQLVPVTGDGQYYSFKGIPYAAPPVGPLRFQAPQPVVPWDGVKNATKHGSVCIQFDILNNIISGSEDCLFLNIYSPNLIPETLLPVMFFIHGGGYESGSGNDDNYGPDFLVSNGVVIITINYRLEVLGFLSLETEEVPGNAGLKDQVTALKWVKNNVENFGGDPDNITVFGQSAGGAAAILHVISRMSKGLFKRAISMSGVPSCDWSIAYKPRRRAFVLGKQLGLDTNDVNELYEFLKTVSADKLVNKSPNILTSEEITGNVLKMFHFTPVIEKNFGQEHFLTENPEEALRRGQFNGGDIIIGHTDEEGIADLISFKNLFLTTYSKYTELLVPRKLLYKYTPDKILTTGDEIREHYFGKGVINQNTLRELLTYINDSTYFYDIQWYIKLLSNISEDKIFVYRFSGVSDRNIYGKLGDKDGLIGASHLDDLAYLFDPKQYNLTLEKNSKEYKMVQQTTTLFTNFAKCGNPTPDNNLGVVWPEYNHISESFLDIAEHLTPGNSLDIEAVTFWKSIFKNSEIRL